MIHDLYVRIHNQGQFNAIYPLEKWPRVYHQCTDMVSVCTLQKLISVDIKDRDQMCVQKKYRITNGRRIHSNIIMCYFEMLAVFLWSDSEHQTVFNKLTYSALMYLADSTQQY